MTGPAVMTSSEECTVGSNVSVSSAAAVAETGLENTSSLAIKPPSLILLKLTALCLDEKYALEFTGSQCLEAVLN